MNGNENNYSIRPATPSYVVKNSAPPVDRSPRGAFETLERKTSEYLARVRREAEQIVEEGKIAVEELRRDLTTTLQREREAIANEAANLEKARRQLESDANDLEERKRALEKETFEEARADGYKKGLEDGEVEGRRTGLLRAQEEFEARVAQEAESRAKTIVDAELAPLRKVVEELKNARQDLLKNWEVNVMQIAAAIAYQAIMREPSLIREAPLELLREALELSMNCATLKIRMNPTDVKRLRPQIDDLLEETGNLAKSEVISDAKITSGGCLVETSTGVVDERLESRLERIVAELSE